MHQGKEGRKTRSDVTFPPSSKASSGASNGLSILLCESKSVATGYESAAHKLSIS